MVLRLVLLKVRKMMMMMPMMMIPIWIIMTVTDLVPVCLGYEVYASNHMTRL